MSEYPCSFVKLWTNAFVNNRKICGIGSFIESSLPQEIIEDKSMVFCFGPTGFFGYGSGGPESANSLMWWSNWDTETAPDRTTIDKDEIKKQLRERHANWKNPVIQFVLENATIDSIYPTWTLPKLPYWGENGLLLIGDAAHALQPTSGQGASQAIEDSLTFALLLSHYLEKAGQPESEITEKDAISLTSKALYEIRSARVARIMDRARKIEQTKKSHGIILEYLMYGFMYLVTNYPSIGKSIPCHKLIEKCTKNLIGK